MALEAGCDDLLRKPFRESDIFDMLASHLGVRFVYEENTEQMAEDKGLKAQNPLTPEAFANVPPDLLTVMEQLAIAGDADGMYQLLDTLQASDAALADALTALTGEFEFDKILALLNKNSKDDFSPSQEIAHQEGE